MSSFIRLLFAAGLAAIVAGHARAGIPDVCYDDLKPASPSLCLAPEAAQSELFNLINSYRQQNGLNRIKWDPKLTLAATSYAAEMAALRRLSHIGIDGGNFIDRARKSGFLGSPCAENLAWNQPTAQRAFQSWLKSESHRKAMLHIQARRGGVGYACTRESGHFWTMTLAR